MKAVIYICHGSRVPAAREQAIAFTKKCMNHSLAPIQEYCFLELASPTIEEAITSCIHRGATKIVVLPVLLLTAAHAKVDIPNELTKAASCFPDIEINYGEPIGVHPKMVEPIIERIQETGEAITSNSLVLLVGRGSSDPDVKRDLNKIADLLKEKTGIMNVETCFLTAVSPNLEEGLQTAGICHYDKIFVIPYLLFTGILMKQINKQIKTQKNRQQYILCNYLGYHHCIESILLERVHRLLEEM